MRQAGSQARPRQENRDERHKGAREGAGGHSLADWVVGDRAEVGGRLEQLLLPPNVSN